MPISIDTTPAQVASSQAQPQKPELPNAKVIEEDVSAAQASVSEVRQVIAAQQAKAAEAAAQEPSSEEVQRAVSDLSDYLNSISRSLSISIDNELGRPIVTVLGGEKSEVIRQIPTEEVVRLAKYLRSQVEVPAQGQASQVNEDVLTGILLNQQS